MSEPELTPEAKAAIRSYLLKLVLPAGTVLSLILFLMGFFIKDIAGVKADNIAYKDAQPYLLQTITQAEIARQQALRALEEVDKLKASVRAVGSGLGTSQEGVARTTESPSAEVIARLLMSDENFAKSLATRAQRPVKTSFRTEVYVRDTQGGTLRTYRCPSTMRMLSCTEILVPSGRAVCSTSISSDGSSCNYGFCGVSPGEQYRVMAVCGGAVSG